MFSFLRRQGDKAEERAAKYLQDNGYKIIKRNYLCPLGEVDIIAQKEGALVFVEVKQRATAAFGGPMAAVTKSKQHKISLTAAEFIKEKALKFDSIRFDVICITGGELTHLQNAFFPPRMTV